MPIRYAILGLLSYKSLTGYDLKKIMQDSPFMYWSGNNNQIYKALVDLHNEGYVTSEIFHQESFPSKKVYTITDAGLSELKRWTLSLPEVPEIRNTFLVQLAWTAQLSNKEIDSLLSKYEQEINGRLAIEQQKINRGCFSPKRTPREACIWELLYDNVLKAYKSELEWVNKVRQALHKFNDADYEKKANNSIGSESEEKSMDYQVVEKDNQKYIKLDHSGAFIEKEQDALKLVSICAENGTNLLLIQDERLPNEFLQLKTGIAGAVLQKFDMYNIKAVAVLDQDRIKGKFRDFIFESNRGNTFRVYKSFDEAEQWLLNNNH